MREIVYYFTRLGKYVTENNTKFLEDDTLKITVKPHDFSMELSGEVLRSSSCKGYSAVVSREGAVTFYDAEGNRIADIDAGDRAYEEVRFAFLENAVSLEFGRMITIDNYPDCDGEYDRWDEKWKAERIVKLDTLDNTVIEEIN